METIDKWKKKDKMEGEEIIHPPRRLNALRMERKGKERARA